MRSNPKHSAFTLLEVILALALSALVMIVLGMAVELHLRLLDSGRTKVEEAQLARAILRLIAQDLLSALPYNSSSADSSSTSSSTTSSTSSSAASSTTTAKTGTTSQIGNKSSAQSGQSGMSGQTGKQSSNSSSTSGLNTNSTTSQSTTSTTASGTDETDRTSDLADAAPQSTPGLYGNIYELQIDVSRLPRADQYIAAANQSDGAINADQLSDVKNVSYFVVNNGAVQTSGAINGAATLSGLVRREIGRATGTFAAQQGQLSTTGDNGTLEPFAPEVQAIEFHYYDGTEWVDAWDSVSYGALPVAVQISIAITPQHPRNATNIQPDIYRLMVSIPAAKSQTTSTSQTSSTSETTPTTTTSQ